MEFVRAGTTVHGAKLGQIRSKRRQPHPSLIDRIALRLSTSKIIDGLWVGIWEDESEPYFRRVEDALSLIKACDRVRYDRLTRDLKRVWVLLLAGPRGSFRVSLGACLLDSRFIIGETSDAIASVIVHEATHARLRHCGFGYEEGVRSRIETVCVRRELAFSRLLPNGDRVRQWAEEKLKWCASPENYSDAALDQQHVEGSLQALRHLGTPDWIGRTIVPLRTLYLRVWRSMIRRKGRR